MQRATDEKRVRLKRRRYSKPKSKLAIAARFRDEYGRERTSDPLALIRKHELSALLGISPWTLDSWRRNGTFPRPIELGSQVLCWRRSDVERWLLQREIASDQRTRHDEPDPRSNSG